MLAARVCSRRRYADEINCATEGGERICRLQNCQWIDDTCHLPLCIRRKCLPPSYLCGGQGTRIRDVAESIPKPMVPVGSQPIIWHIMKTYAAFGVRRFILCLGYRREALIDYFLNYRARAMDITVQLAASRQRSVPRQPRRRRLGSHADRYRRSHDDRRTSGPRGEISA